MAKVAKFGWEDLRGFKEKLYQECLELYNELASTLIASAAETKELEKNAKKLAKEKKLRKVRREKVELQLKTGHKIKISSLFASSQSKSKRKKCGPNGSGRHLILDLWSCIKKASPSYYSSVTMLSILCPSFEIECRVLEQLHIKNEYKRIRDLAYAVGEKSFSNRVKVGLRKGENLIGKRVLISIDGGRTRMREKNLKKEK